MFLLTMPETSPDWLRLARRLIIDVVTPIVALGGIITVTTTPGPERPTLLFTFLAMLGIPLAWRADEARKRARDEKVDS